MYQKNENNLLASVIDLFDSAASSNAAHNGVPVEQLVSVGFRDAGEQAAGHCNAASSCAGCCRTIEA